MTLCGYWLYLQGTDVLLTAVEAMVTGRGREMHLCTLQQNKTRQCDFAHWKMGTLHRSEICEISGNRSTPVSHRPALVLLHFSMIFAL